MFLRNLSQNLVVEENNLRLEFKATSRFAEYTIKEPERIRAIEQTNSTALVDNQYVAKIYRQLEAGINPEIEIGSYLTEVARFANAPALLGSVELVEGDRRSAVGVVARLCREPGRRLGRDRWLSRPLYRRAAAAASQATMRPGDPGAGALSALHCADRPARSPSCMWLWPPQSPAISRRSRSAPRTSSAGHPTSRHGPNGFSSGWRDSRDRLREADRPLIDQLAAMRASLSGRLECAAAFGNLAG